MDDQYYSVKSLAKKLNVAPITIRRLITHGVIGAIRIGRAIRISPEVVDDFLKSVIVGSKGLQDD